jgi:hypothetical protein
MTFFSQARRTCGTTHFIRPCTILHATGFGLPPYFEDWFKKSDLLQNSKLLQCNLWGIWDSYLPMINVPNTHKAYWLIVSKWLLFNTMRADFSSYIIIPKTSYIKIRRWCSFCTVPSRVVMGIGHIFKIDDRYTNIDRWSIISNNYLLNVFTDYNYSDSLWIKSYHIFTNYNFSICKH